jgi:HPr kinase/phosphorylase
MLLHASCAARGADAVLFLGSPGSGKSDLVLRLLGLGWALVADDQVRLSPDGGVAAPAELLGQLEVRGLGIFSGLRCAAPPLRLRLAVECLAPGLQPPRLPAPRRWSQGGVSLPLVSLGAVEASAPLKVEWALDAALGLRAQVAGAFAG